jgi:hypothetical protein
MMYPQQDLKDRIAEFEGIPKLLHEAKSPLGLLGGHHRGGAASVLEQRGLHPPPRPRPKSCPADGDPSPS